MAFNFMTQWNIFHKLCDVMLPIKAQIIYYKLLKWSNYFDGNPFQLTNQRLMLDCQITNEKSFIDNRNLLKQRGFIEFKAGKKGYPTIYILSDLTKFTFNMQVNIEVDNEVNTEVDSEVNNTVNTEVNAEANTEVDTAGDMEGDSKNLPFILNQTKLKQTVKEDIKENDNEKEKISSDLADVFHEWENLFGSTISSVRFSQLKDLVNDFGRDITIYAIQEARKRSISSMMYVRSIAKNESGRRNGTGGPGSGTGITDPFLKQLYDKDMQRQADEIREMSGGGDIPGESGDTADTA